MLVQALLRRQLTSGRFDWSQTKRVCLRNVPEAEFDETRGDPRECCKLNPYPERPVEYKLLFLKRRSRVQEIVVINESLLITLQHSGVCCVFKRSGGSASAFKQHGYLNHRPEEIVRSLFYNRAASAIVIVSVYPADKKSVLRCRSISVEDVDAGRFERSVPILTKEVLGYPGWIELCEVNAKILTYSAETQAYKVWDLKAGYKFQYQVTPRRGERLQDVKASPGFLLLIHEPTVNSDEQRFQRITLLDISDGLELYSINYPLRTRIELVEQFCDNILIKEQDRDLVIHNVRVPSVAEKFREISMGPNRLNAFTFLHSSRIFLTFQSGGKIASFDAQGREICTVNENEPGMNEDFSGIVLVARDQETLLCVKKDSSTRSLAMVEFRHVLTGELLTRVPLKCPISEVTCLCYDEERMILFVGTRDGLVHVWET